MIPIGRRIGEILEERGKAFSLRAFSARIGISKDTLKRMIDGERPISRAELTKIADGLKLSVERLKQEDTNSQSVELESLLKSLQNRKRAILLAQELVDVAVGISERCHAYDKLGFALFNAGDLDGAHQAWREALTYAEQLERKYQQSDVYHRVLHNQIVTLTERKEFEELSELIDRGMMMFQNNPEYMGALYYSKAILHSHRGEIELYGECSRRSLDYLRQTNIPLKIGRAEVNLSYHEFKEGNYEAAKMLLESAVVHLEVDGPAVQIAMKEYVKVLLKLGEHEQAAKIAEELYLGLRVDGQDSLRGKLAILLTIAKKDVRYVETLLDNLKLEKIFL